MQGFKIAPYQAGSNRFFEVRDVKVVSLILQESHNETS